MPPPLMPRKTGSRVRTITALVLREMQSRYGRSPGGYIWAVLEPMGMILILSFVFALMLRTPDLGNSFVLFYASGFLPFTMYSRIQQMTSNALTFSRALLTYPVVNWVDAVIARVILNVLTGLMVASILLTAILILTDNRTSLEFVPMILAYTGAIAIGLGVGLVNCVLIGFFPVWQTIWAVLTRPLFIASGVIIIFENLPGVGKDILYWNPLFHVTGLMRMGIYPTYEPQYVSLTFVWTVALVTIAFGVLLMRRFHARFLRR